MADINNTLAIYRGDTIDITDKIKIRQPIISEIVDYGEKEYFSLVTLLTASPFDLIAQLDEMGIEFDKVDDYDIFCMFCRNYIKEQSSIVFGDFDFTSLQVGRDKKSDEIVLYHPEQGVLIDKRIHYKLTEGLRRVHCFKKNPYAKVANEFTKQTLIEEARLNARYADKKPVNSILQPLISTCVAMGVSTFKDIWNLPISAFMDCVRRTQIIKSTDNLYSGICSGNVDMKKINKKELDYMREIR